MENLTKYTLTCDWIINFFSDSNSIWAIKFSDRI